MPAVSREAPRIFPIGREPLVSEEIKLVVQLVVLGPPNQPIGHDRSYWLLVFQFEITPQRAMYWIVSYALPVWLYVEER